MLRAGMVFDDQAEFSPQERRLRVTRSVDRITGRNGARRLGTREMKVLTGELTEWHDAICMVSTKSIISNVAYLQERSHKFNWCKAT